MDQSVNRRSSDRAHKLRHSKAIVLGLRVVLRSQNSASVLPQPRGHCVQQFSQDRQSHSRAPRQHPKPDCPKSRRRFSSIPRRPGAMRDVALRVAGLPRRVCLERNRLLLIRSSISPNQLTIARESSPPDSCCAIASYFFTSALPLLS